MDLFLDSQFYSIGVCVYPYASSVLYVNVVYHIDEFSYVEPPLYSWNKSCLFMVYNFLKFCWIWFADMLLCISILFIRDIDLCFLFLWYLYLALVQE